MLKKLSHTERAVDRKRALQYLTDLVEALAAGMNMVPLLAAGFSP